MELIILRSNLANMTHKFIAELKRFSRTNWWVFFVYLAMVGIIRTYAEGKISDLFLIPSIHFIADIFIMMMFSAYARKEYSQGTSYQVIAMLLLLSAKIYTGFASGDWYFLAADVIYILAAIKNYWLDMNNIDIKSVNYVTMSILSFLIFTVLYLSNSVFEDGAETILTIGIFIFAVALATTDQEKLRYLLSLIGLIVMVVGSFLKVMIGLEGDGVIGLALSYFLLPLTVLVFYIKSWSIVMHETD